MFQPIIYGSSGFRCFVRPSFKMAVRRRGSCYPTLEWHRASRMGHSFFLTQLAELPGSYLQESGEAIPRR